MGAYTRGRDISVVVLLLSLTLHREFVPRSEQVSNKITRGSYLQAMFVNRLRGRYNVYTIPYMTHRQAYETSENIDDGCNVGMGVFHLYSVLTV